MFAYLALLGSWLVLVGMLGAMPWLTPPTHPTPLDHTQAVGWVRVGGDGQGTGWLIDGPKRLLVTALHVVGKADRLTATFPYTRDGRMIVDRADYLAQTQALRQSGRLVDGEVIARHADLDLAVVRLDAVPAGAEPLKLRTTRAMPGEPITLIGQRGDLDALWSRTRGYVRQIGPLTAGYGFAGEQLARAATMLYLQLPINVGDSGGPVLDAYGAVLGMVVAYEKKAPPTALAVSAQTLARTLGQPVDQAQPAEQTKPVSPAVQIKPADPNRPAMAVGPTVFTQAIKGLATVQTHQSPRRSTAWIVDQPRRLLLTSARAVAWTERVIVTLPQFDPTGQVHSDRQHYQQERVLLARAGLIVEGIVLARDQARDLALLEVAGLPAHAQALPLGRVPPRVGEPVHLLGNPAVLDVLWVYAAGSVRQQLQARLDPAPNADAPAIPALALQAPALAGDSGGPVLNDAGEVVAVQTGRDEPQQQVVYAVTTDEVRSFLTTHQHRFAPTSVGEWEARCDRFLAHASPTLALRVCDEAIRAHPKASELLLRRASARLACGQLDAARTDLDTAQQAKASAEGWALLAAWHNAKGQPDEALRAADAALKLSARSAAAFTARAEARFALGQTSAARADLDEALWHNVNHAKAYLLRAAHAKSPVEREQAIVDCTRAIELRPSDPAGYRLRAELHLANNDRKAAHVDWASLADQLLDDAELRVRLARSALAMGDLAIANQPGREAILLAPTHARQLLPALVECATGGDTLGWLQIARGWLQAAGRGESALADRARRLLVEVDACKADLTKQEQTMRRGLRANWAD